jgi:exopolyphosphatase/guanosine-5'-triphosphate,3'-diphosphate pyrophosphatase
VARAGLNVAAIDIGTNSVRMLILEGGSEVERRVEVVGLGSGVDSKGRLKASAIERTLEALSSFRSSIDGHRVTRVRAVATSASRDAANVDEFLDSAELVLGVRPGVISGDEEASLSHEGVVAAFAGSGPALVIDVGGGSTEFVLGDSKAEHAASIDIGSVRLTDRMLSDRPAGEDAVAAAQEHVAGLFEDVAFPFPPQQGFGAGGTFTSLAAIHLGLQSYDRSLVHGSTLSVEALESLVHWLATMTIAETEQIPSLDPLRAPVILSGAVVAHSAVRTSGLGAVTVSEHDLLDAVAWKLLND